MNSLRARLIVAASVVLAVFIVLAGYTLDEAFYESADIGLRENLSTQLTLLMASTEVKSADDIDMPSRLLETKFSLPSSGLNLVSSKNPQASHPPRRRTDLDQGQPPSGGILCKELWY